MNDQYHAPSIDDAETTWTDGPVTYEQDRMLAVAQVVSDRPVHHIAQVLRIEGPVDGVRLERALGRVIEAHGSLRTAFANTADGFVQRCFASVPWHLDVQDAADESDAALDAAVAALVAPPFDPLRPPLFRLCLRRGARHHHLVGVFHHLIFDLLSWRIFVNDLVRAYDAPDAALAGEATTALTLAREQRAALTAERLDAQCRYWRRRLPGSADPLAMIRLGRARSFTAERLTFDMPAAAVVQAARSCRVTPFVVLLTAYLVVLHHLGDGRPFFVNVPVAGRDDPARARLIASLTTPLVVGSELTDELTAGELFGRVLAELMNRDRDREVPFAQVVETIAPGMDAQANPLALQFSYLGKMPDGMAARDGCVFTSEPHRGRGTSDVDLFLTLYQHDDMLSGVLIHDPACIAPATAERIAAAYRAVVQDLCAAPDVGLRELASVRDLRALRRAVATTVPVHLAATFTADPLADGLRAWARHLDLDLAVDGANFGQVIQELLHPDSGFGRNRDGVNVVLTRPGDWRVRDDDGAPAANYDFTPLCHALDTYRQRGGASCLVVVAPEADRSAGETAALVERLRRDLPSGAADLLAWDDLRPTRADDAIFDVEAERLGAIPYTPAAFATMATAVVRWIVARRAPPRKVVVLDCDNTLWGGVCGEVGPAGVRVDGPYAELQRFMRACRQRGMLLCLCSKNQPDDVHAVFATHPQMPLRRDDIICERIDWQPKAENLIALSRELGLGLESFIFVDDNPVEVAQVQSRCPEVITVCLPDDPSAIPDTLAAVWAFDGAPAGEEDAQRSQRYQQESRRRNERARYDDYFEFLDDLELRIDIRDLADEAYPRAAQLTTRTNQFNANLRRRDEAALAHLLADGTHRGYSVHVSDRFGDYGLVGLVILAVDASRLVVDTFLLSCRALGRGVEQAMLAHVGEVACAEDCATVVVPYVAGTRNVPVFDFLRDYAIDPQPQRHDQNLRFTAMDIRRCSIRDHADRYAGDGDASSASVPHDAGVLRGGEHRVLVAQARAPQSWPSLLAGEKGAAEAMAADLPPTAAQVAEIWADVLGVAVRATDDDFFDLGGNSVCAVQVLARINRTFAVSLGIVDVFDHPTLGAFAERIEEQELAQADDELLKDLLVDLQHEEA